MQATSYNVAHKAALLKGTGQISSMVTMLCGKILYILVPVLFLLSAEHKIFSYSNVTVIHVDHNVQHIILQYTDVRIYLGAFKC